MKIFVTGATGFIGNNLIKKLIAEGHEVTVNVRGGKDVVIDKVNQYQLENATIADDIEFLKTEKFDGVIHLASLYLSAHKPDDVNNLVSSNVRFSTYVLESAVQAGIKWFINTGTFWQNYEDRAYSPVNLYAATKQAFESIAQYYIETGKILFNTLKLSDTFGPNDPRPKVFNLWDNLANKGGQLDMSPGEQQIDISYIDDVINAFLLLAVHLNNATEVTNGHVYAVKAGHRFKLKDLAAVFEKATGKTLNINWGARPYREREVMVPWQDGEVVPGWQPTVNVEEGIKKTFS